MRKRPTAPNPGAAPTAAAAVDRLRFPASGQGGGGSTATGAAGRELVVEVEFLSPERAQLAQAVFDPNLGSSTGAVADAALQAVLQRFPPQQVAPAHSVARLRAEAENLQRLRATAAVSAAAAGELSALERLPAAASFVHMRFAPGTPADEVVKALRGLPGVARAVRVPQAAPPEPGLPTDPLIGSADSALQADPQTGLERQWYLHRMKLPQAWPPKCCTGTAWA